MKMREALVGLARAVRAFMATKGANFYPGIAIALKAANAALSEPERNCEQLAAPTDSNGNTIHVADKVHMLNTDSRGDHEWDDEVNSLEFIGSGGGDEWLIHGHNGAAWACECEVLKRKGEGDVQMY